MDVALEYSGEFKDKQQVKEFLQGAEPADDKIDAVVRYLECADPNLANAIEDDGFENLVGDVFSQLIAPTLTDRAILERSHRLSRFEGLYEHIEVDHHESITPRLDLIHLKATPNSHYLTASLLMIDWRSHPESASQVNRQIAGITPFMISTMASDAGAPHYAGGEGPYRNFAEYVLAKERAGEAPVAPYHYIGRGFLFPRDDTYFFMYQRHVASLDPTFYAGMLHDDGSIAVTYFDIADALFADKPSNPFSVPRQPMLRYKRLPADIEKTMSSFIAKSTDDVR